MANPNYAAYTTTGAKTPVVLNWVQTPFNASWGTFITGTCTYGVEYTLDDPNGTLPVRWYPDANGPAGSTTSIVGNYMFPIVAVRINITAISGSIEFKVLQGLQVS